MLRLINEDEEKKLKFKDDENRTEVIPVPKPEMDSDDGIEYSMVKQACKSNMNDLIQEAWGFISNINSSVMMLDMDYKESNKSDIIELLNTIVNDLTINIGVLETCGSMIDNNADELIASGKEKAENILSK